MRDFVSVLVYYFIGESLKYFKWIWFFAINLEFITGIWSLAVDGFLKRYFTVSTTSKYNCVS